MRFKKVVQMVSYMPHFLSTVVICSMLTLFMNERTGVFNTFIDFFGGQRVDFLTKANYFEDIYVWSGVWQSVGFSSILYISALSGVSSELIEAARIDGATRLQIIRHVNIPAISSTIIIQLIFACGGILSLGYEKVLLLQNPLNLSRAQVISTYTYEIGLVGGQFSYSAAIGLFNTIVNLIIIGSVNWIAKKVSGTGLF